MTPNDYCRDKVAAEGSNLHYSLLFLDPLRREAITALHAFRQEIADIIEKSADIEPARAKLAWWRMEIGALYEQRPDHPVTRALATMLAHFPVAQERLQEVIDGFEMDLDQGQYDDFESLRLYCYRVSGVVNAITAEILGYTNPQTAGFADELGLAMQLTSMIRDVGWHARQGRIYLPLDELNRFGVNADDIYEARPGDEIRALLAFQAQRAREHHNKALSMLAHEDRKSQRSLLAMAALQRALLDEIERDGYQVLDHGLSLTPLRKLWLVTRTWLGA